METESWNGMYVIRRIFNPEIYQGKYKHNNYFEGWYYKLIDKTSQNILGVIPGVSFSERDRHAFIQFIDANSGFTEYVKFRMEDFHYSEKVLDIKINRNYFNKFGLTVDIDSANLNVCGNVDFVNIVPFPKSFFNPGIMGPYSFVPFMECHHGIVNMHCDLRGSLVYNGKNIDFTGGYGYLEKDWGSSFPEAWIWLQSNHFAGGNVSVMFSVASIPWINRSFNGFISFLKINDRLYRFASYTGARIYRVNFKDQKLYISVGDSRHLLKLEVNNSRGGILKAPKKGMMDVEITETITSSVKVTLYNRKGERLYSGTGNNTGLELAGEYEKFLT